MIFAFQQKVRLKSHSFLSLYWREVASFPLYIIIITNPGEKRGNIEEQLKMHNLFA